MLYTITGADRTTGQEVSQTLHAKSPAEAESIASLTMFVSKVAPVPAPVAVVPVNDLEAAVIAAANSPVPYATPAKRDRAVGIDWATGLATHARFLRILSWPVAACAVPFAMMSVKDLLDSLYYFGPVGILRYLGESEFGRVLTALILLATAVFLRVTAHAALALRHFATRPEENAESSDFKSEI